MKKIILLSVSIIIFGLIVGTNVKTNIDNSNSALIIENTDAFATMAKSCSWTGWFGIRHCEISCSACSYVECSRRGGCVAG
ncbi:MAG: hypothetical protein JXR51_01590 [Bacteroidales bacterium]|nr:hypothetical protein [Bacteroidales bacterium]